jgi:hypothetical protein
MAGHQSGSNLIYQVDYNTVPYLCDLQHDWLDICIFQTHEQLIAVGGGCGWELVLVSAILCERYITKLDFVLDTVFWPDSSQRPTMISGLCPRVFEKNRTLPWKRGLTGSIDP